MADKTSTFATRIFLNDQQAINPCPSTPPKGSPENSELPFDMVGITGKPKQGSLVHNSLIIRRPFCSIIVVFTEFSL